MRDFNYLRATTVKEACDLLDAHREDCKIICGGQSLLILMRQGLVAPGNLIDIKGVKELRFINHDSKEGLTIGAAATHRDIELSDSIRSHYPVLAEMEENVASIQTRNWGTIGGNLAHADPAGDPGTVLVALNARVKTATKKKERVLPLEEFFLDYFETVLEEDELLVEIQVPVSPPETATVYEKFNIIKNDQGIVSVAASVTLSNGSCREARIVLGAAAPTPIRAKEAEQMLAGEKLTPGLLDEIGTKASEEAEPITDIHATEAYRRHLVGVLTRKLVEKAWEKAQALPR